MQSVSRLFTKFQPNNYNLELELNRQELTFRGNLVIKGRVSVNSSDLVLHSKNLNILNIKINSIERSFEQIDDELHIKLLEMIQSGSQCIIEISYNGTITKPMHGLYPCFTKDNNVILATQFESHHAREVFPCIDEPEAKATFDLTLITDKVSAVIGNMPICSSKVKNNQLISTFDTTPIMSTYLLAFVVGDLHKVSGKTKNGTEVNIWSSKDHKKDTLKFALDASIKSTEFLNVYFDTPYPLPKCDHVALPDFSSGAMENWGLITYREVCLLVDPKTTSTNGQELVATVIAHELSHQWFGNLVTMRWWNDLWLNESFANLMEYIIVDSIWPEWEVMLSFAASEALGALRRDMLPGVQAVSTEVKHPDQISTLFDPSIVYAKGSRLLLMAYNLVGDEAFRKGLKNYFKKYAYSNTEGADLWQCLEESSGKRVGSIMKSWVSQPGFPVVRVRQIGNELQLRQRPLRTIKSIGEVPLWPIPLSAKPSIKTSVLRTESKTIELSSETYVQLNTAGGHFSVHYETQPHRKSLMSKIEDKSMPADQRLLLINDQLMLSRSGIIGMDEVMDVLSSFVFETEEPVWAVISMAVANARKIVEDNKKAEKSLKTFVWNFVKSEYERLGWYKQKNESLNDTKLRGVILSLATYSEEPSVIKKAIAEYSKFENIADIPADTRHIIMNSAVKNGSPIIFDKLFKLYPETTNAELSSDIASALTSTKDSKNINRLLSNLSNPEYIRLQDVDKFLVQLLFSTHSKNKAWDWIVNNWDWIVNNFKSDKSYDNYPRYSATAFSTEKQLKEYKDFFWPMRKEPALTRNIELGLAEIENRVSWRNRDELKLVDWLINQQSQ